MRVRSIRKQFDLSRPQFANRLSLRPATLQNWEDARRGGLSPDGAFKLVKNLRENNFYCSEEWLLDGEGGEPFFIQSHIADSSISKQYQAMIIAKELRYFHRLNSDAVDIVTTDESLSPLYLIEDRVAGKRLFSDDINNAINLPCIVQVLNDSTVLVGILKKGDKKNSYTLEKLNNKEIILQNVELLSAAPIIRMWRIFKKTN